MRRAALPEHGLNLLLNECAQQYRGEQRVRSRVSPPHPPRLLVDAIKPFQPERLHANWRTRDLAGENIEGATYSHDEGDFQIVTVRRKEALLARRRHANEQAIRPAVPNIGDDLRLPVWREVTILQSGEVDCGIFLQNLTFTTFEDLGCGAKKVWPKPILRTHRKKFRQQIDSGDPFPDRQAEKPGGPNNSHSINPDKIAACDIGREDRVSSRINQLGDVQRDMLQSVTTLHGTSSEIDCLRHGQDVNGAIQQNLPHLVALK